MNKIPVVFTFDKRIILGAAVTIKSLIDTAKPETAVIVGLGDIIYEYQG